MKAIVYTKYGSPEVLQLNEVEKPFPKDNEVLVKTYAASVNSWDWDLLRGKPYLYRLLFGLFKPKYKIIGCDVAGRVEAVGRNVKQLQRGDAVFGDISERWGGFAEYVCAPEKSLSLKPASVTFEEAAAIPQAAVLALQSLRDKRQIRQGDKVLINGAGGGVGTFALQMAKAFGAEVTCVDSTEKLNMLRSLGADHVIDYRQEDFTARLATDHGQCYDLIIDVVAYRSIFAYKRALRPHGILVVVGGTIAAILQAAILGPLMAMTGNKKMGILIHQPNKDLAFIKALIEEGKIKPMIDKTFPLHEVPKALQYLGEGHAQGKVVITVKHDEITRRTDK